jgi:sugar/nucleoside kinase (ribokinase family)
VTHVVCVGDLMVDVLARLPGPLAPNSDTPAPVTLAGGGAAANVAAWVACAGAGAEATFVGRVGDDPLGRRAVDDLRAAGVRAAVAVDADRPTGVCIVLDGPDGERTMIPSAGANAGPGAALPERADWLYLSGYALLADGSRGFARTALAHARDRGWQIAVDVASTAPLAALGAQRFLDLAGEDVVLFANAAEAAVLTGRDDPAAAAGELALRCGRAVVKRGAAGAVWSDGVDLRSVAAPVVELVDSTGAGDAFAAGFLAVTADPADDSAPRLATAVELAARAVQRLGARPPQPDERS